MKYAVAVICRPSLAPGFVLAGVETIPARDADEASARLRELRERSGPGVVFVEETLQEERGGVGVADRAEEDLPLVVPFPGPLWEPREEPEARVLDLLRRAVGYRVRLR
jgi:vacuolar-type H+-ATPase subunit F/Vma7